VYDGTGTSTTVDLSSYPSSDDVSYGVFARDADGTTGTVASAVVEATRIRLAVPRLAIDRAPEKLGALISDLHSAPQLSGGYPSLTLQHRDSSAAAWTTWRSIPGNGSKITVRFTKTEQLRAVFGGATYLRASASPSYSVPVAPALSVSAAHSVRRGTSITIHVRVTPPSAIGRIGLQREVAGAWKSAGLCRRTGRSAGACADRPTTTGKLHLRVVAAAGGRQARAVSRTLTVHVTP
jgi:hypothetical protein